MNKCIYEQCAIVHSSSVQSHMLEECIYIHVKLCGSIVQHSSYIMYCIDTMQCHSIHQ